MRVWFSVDSRVTGAAKNLKLHQYSATILISLHRMLVWSVLVWEGGAGVGEELIGGRLIVVLQAAENHLSQVHLLKS